MSKLSDALLDAMVGFDEEDRRCIARSLEGERLWLMRWGFDTPRAGKNRGLRIVTLRLAFRDDTWTKVDAEKKATP